MPTIKTIVNEPPRLCGERRSGALYLTSDGPSSPCHKMPIPMVACPVCGGGIHPTRVLTRITPRQLWEPVPCNFGLTYCFTCPAGNPPEKAGLLWVGIKYYPTPADWAREAVAQGVSRRIGQLPKGLKLGETWIYVGHRHAIVLHTAEGEQFQAAIFHAFQPSRIEYIVKDEDTEEQLTALEKRGVTLVRLVREESVHERS